MPDLERSHCTVLIVGSGFAGLAMAIRLQRAGLRDYLVLERAGDVGGTWRDNTYPGCTCDVPSNLYSLSFAGSSDWTCTYPRQAEIWEYLRRCAREHGVLPQIRFHTAMLDARWDSAASLWRVRTDRGEISARFLVLGVGALSEPAVPELPGLDGFRGTVFHSAAWRHDHELRGETVAVVGTGASAIQFVPQIQPQVRALHLYQRTAPWVMPHRNRALSAAERWLARTVPLTQRLRRVGIYAARELLVLGFTVEPRIMALAERASRQHLERQVADASLRRALTPRYRLGCKRVLISNDYYPALTRANVELVTSPILQVRERSIVSGDGVERPTDTIIFGTGFHVSDRSVADVVRGRTGATLAQTWRGSPQAYVGTTVAGFPNFFYLAGPNTGLGHTSVVYMIEAQVEHVMRCLEALRRERASVIEVREQAQREYNAQVQERMRSTVWTTGGCSSWYIDAQGRNSALWPTFTFLFRRRATRFDRRAYRLERAAQPRAA